MAIFAGWRQGLGAQGLQILVLASLLSATLAFCPYPLVSSVPHASVGSVAALSCTQVRSAPALGAKVLDYESRAQPLESSRDRPSGAGVLGRLNMAEKGRRRKRDIARDWLHYSVHQIQKPVSVVVYTASFATSMAMTVGSSATGALQKAPTVAIAMASNVANAPVVVVSVATNLTIAVGSTVGSSLGAAVGGGARAVGSSLEAAVGGGARALKGMKWHVKAVLAGSSDDGATRGTTGGNQKLGSTGSDSLEHELALVIRDLELGRYIGPDSPGSGLNEALKRWQTKEDGPLSLAPVRYEDDEFLGRPEPVRAKNGFHDHLSLRTEGFAAASKGEPEEAVDFLQQYLAWTEFPDPEAWNCQGEMFLQMGLPQEAVVIFERAIWAAERNSDLQAKAVSHLHLGDIHMQSGEFEMATKSFRTATEIQPKNIQALHKFGKALCEINEVKEALEVLNEAARLDPLDPEIMIDKAKALSDSGANSEAVKAYQDAQRAGAKEDIEFLLNLGANAQRANMIDVARSALDQVLQLDEGHVMARRLLKALDPSAAHLQLSPEEDAEYSRRLFDNYAGDWESEMVDELNYQAPEDLVALTLALTNSNKRIAFKRALDLGCGSGLSGEELRPHCGQLIGCDISKEMVKIAMEREQIINCKWLGLTYDRVEQSELVKFLDAIQKEEEDQGEDNQGFNLVIAVDVLNYMSDLQPFFDAAAKVLRRGQGLLAFSTEQPLQTNTDTEGWLLKPTLRYGHEVEYITQAAADAGLSVILREEATLFQTMSGDSIDGFYWVMKLQSQN